MKKKKAIIILSIVIGLIVLSLFVYYYISVVGPECQATPLTYCDDRYMFCQCSDDNTILRYESGRADHNVICAYGCEEKYYCNGLLCFRTAECKPPPVLEKTICYEKVHVLKIKYEECLTQIAFGRGWRDYRQTFKEKTEFVQTCPELCENGKCVCVEKTFCKNDKIYKKHKDCNETVIKTCLYGCKDDKECAERPLTHDKPPQQNKTNDKPQQNITNKTDKPDELQNLIDKINDFSRTHFWILFFLSLIFLVIVYLKL